MSSDPISAKDILEWCFVIGSLDLAVFGFLYNTYAAAKFSPSEIPITEYLRLFCRALSFILVALLLLSVFISITTSAPWPVWIIIICLGIVYSFAVRLALKMEK